ncbi:MAG: hypothetical protein BroJett040_08640 [Oligoflexia bacterium]|nr:MAG: hypothetical protein BroJett040_08640 [Oligoflexia bacterium]
MTKTIMSLTALFLFYLIYGFYLSQVDLAVVPPNLKRENPPGFYDYRGVTNVRSELSSGLSSPLEIVADAKKIGLDFLILTDANQVEHPKQYVGYHGNLLVMVEGEYSFLDSRLLFYSPQNESLPNEAGELNLFFTDLLSQKQPERRENILVLAEPFRDGQTWQGNLHPGVDGIEIVNPKSISRNAWKRSKIDVLWSLVVYPFNPQVSFLRLFREPREEIILWDKISQDRRLTAFSGADASARAIPLANYLMKFPSYQKTLEVTSNHVLLESELTGNLQKDRQKIFSALKKGQFYVALDLLGDPKGFLSTLTDRDKVYPIGSAVKYNKNLRIQAKLPIEPRDFYEIVLFKNGERELTVNQPELNYEVKGPGRYRIVVRVSPTLPIPDGKKWITWIYTNNYYID